MEWGRRKPDPVLAQQEASREALRAAVAGWALLLGATEAEHTMIMATPNRDGKPLAISVRIVTTGLDT